MRSLLLSFLTLLACAHAQQRVVVPAAFAAAEGDRGFLVAGTTHAERMQIVIDAAHLAAANGRSLVGLEFRRDAGLRDELAAASVDVVVRVGTARRAASAASATFADNGDALVEVFRGVVSLPRAPAVTGSVGWSADQMWSVRFAQPFPYAGGGLVVDVEGAPSGAASFWPVDATGAVSDAVALVVGRACGPFVDVAGRNNHWSRSELVPGETAMFDSWGEPGAAAFLLIGLHADPTGTDLAPLGAPGCRLHVLGLAALATTFGAARFGAALGGPAVVAVQLPADSALAGARFAAQWVQLGSAVSTSEAVACTIASSLPGLGVAWILGERGAPTGHVTTTSAPVLRLSIE